MKRNTKRFASLLLAAAMAFGLSTAAFAEQATPETAAASGPAVQAQAAPEDNAPVVQNNVENPAAKFLITSWDDQNNDTTGEPIYCATVQEAINLAVEAGKTADIMHSAPNIYLMRDVAESITVPRSNWQLWLNLNTHNLTADNGPAITLQSGAQLGIRSWQGQTVVAGGSNSAIVCSNGSNLTITGGIFTSDTDVIQAANTGSIWIASGNFSNKLPDSMIPDGYEQVERAGMYTVRQATKAIARVEGKPQYTEYTSVQEAINAAIAEANSNGFRSVRLLGNVTESITLEGLTGNLDIDLDGWTLKAEDGKPAITAGAISGEGRVFIKDSSGSGTVNGGKSSAVLVKETNANNSSNINLTGGSYTSEAAPVLVVNGKAYITGGNFVGAAGQPVVRYGTDEAYSGGNSPNGCIKMAGGTWRAAADGCLLAVQPRTGSTGFAWCDVIEGNYQNVKSIPTCYGELGSTDVVNNGVGVVDGYFDREVPANCLRKGYAQVQENGLWKVFRDHSVDVAAVVSDDINESYASLADAVNNAAWLSSQNGGRTYTVKLLKDVTESVIVSDNGSNTFNLDLNGHTLTAQADKDYAVISNARTAYIDDSSAGKTGAVYGTVYFANSNDSLNSIRGGNFHAVNGPAIITAGGVTVSGGSIYGAANQPVLDTIEGSKTPGYTFMGGSEVRAGEGGKIFDGFDGLTKMNFIITDFCSSANTKFYGDLGVSAAYIKGGYFDRQVPAAFLQDGYTQVQENGMWRVTRDIDVKKTEQKVEATVDTDKTEVPKSEENIPEDKQPTQQDAADKAKALKEELTADNTAVTSFKDNNLTNTVRVNELKGVVANSTVQLYVQAVLKDIQLGTTVAKDTEGNVEVKLSGKTLVFDVTPMAKVDSNDAVAIANNLLNGNSVVFRLPIPAEVTEKYAEVLHEGDAKPFYVEIKTENGKKYIELSATHFSLFTVNFTNELPVEPVDPVKPAEPAQPAAPAQNDTAPAQSSSAAATAPAAKQDDSAYYTCKACGYHDWTAVDGGYKCSHCGYIESVKQLAGYRNVKGTAQVGKTAAAKTSAKALSAIPQTSDDMPVAALMILAAAALLGLCVTAAAKRKHSK